MWVGYAAGTAAAGSLVQHAGGDITVAFLGAGGAAAVAAGLSLLVRTPAPKPPTAPDERPRTSVVEAD
jgi:hypothetical protein